jgi:hypothetical protein
MPNWLRILLLILFAGFMVLVVAGFLGYRWVQRHRGELLAGTKQQQDDARRFAQGKNTNDCVEEALNRVHAKSDFIGQVHARVWINECLRDAEESPATCEKVPSGMIDAARWAAEECARRNMTNDQACVGIYQEVVNHCHRRR